MNQKGFTLVESLLALSILGIALAGILPTFLAYLDSNTLSEERSDAVAAAQLVMERMREEDPVSMPTTGSSAVEIITVGDRDYEVQRHFCVLNNFCSSDSRHVIVEVTFGGETVYALETVFTSLR